MGQDFFEKYITPEKLFRAIVLICLVGVGLSAIYVTSHVGSMEASYVQAHDLATYFFTAIWIFVFFYAQYRVVPRFIHRDLDRRVGLWHAFGSLALLIAGALSIILSQTMADISSRLLVWIALLGEATFVGNVIWSYVQGPQAVPLLPVVKVAQSSPVIVRDDSAKNMGWPKSPSKLFGIGAAFFAAGGVISLVLNVPSFKIPVPLFGEMHFLPYGCLWLVAAAPFGLFALLYRFLMDAQHPEFEDSLNRTHFAVTIIAVLDMVRVFGAWQQTLVSKMAALYFGPEFLWLFVLFGLSAVVFAINAYRIYRKNVVRA